MSDRKTAVCQIDPWNPDPALIARAAELIRVGRLVAFPTETVYGLGANGLDAEAVAGIYVAKGRPARNPIILHVASTEEAKFLVSQWTAEAQTLADRFWPGPLTIVLSRSQHVTDIVTAGGPTVAIRCPTHPIALALIRAAGVPVAAPSANRSGELSPTLAEHVLLGLDGRIDLLLDGGPTAAGIESTVVDLSGPIPVLLRPGPISPALIEAAIGPLLRHAAGDLAHDASTEPLRSPGMLDRHYAPRTPLEGWFDYEQIVDRSVELWRAGQRIGMIYFGEEATDSERIVRVAMPRNPHAYSANLYRVLHELDARKLDRILIQLPPMTDEWLAVRDRLSRAAVT